MFPRPLRTVLHTSTLVLTLPQILIKTPTIPLPFRSRRVTDASISHLVSAVVIFTFAAATPELFYVLSNVTLMLTLAGTYLLPGKALPFIFDLIGGLNLFCSRDSYHLAQYPQTLVYYPTPANTISPELRRAQCHAERPPSSAQGTSLAEASPIPKASLGYRDLDSPHPRRWLWLRLGWR